MVKYTHPSVVVGIDIDSGDSYGVQRVPDTQKTSKIPLPTDLPSKNPPTIPVPKKYPSSVRQNTGMWWIFFKNISHTTSHHTILMVLYAKIGFQASSISIFSIIPPTRGRQCLGRSSAKFCSPAVTETTVTRLNRN